MDTQERILVYIDTLIKYIEFKSHIDEIHLSSMLNTTSLGVIILLGLITVGYSDLSSENLFVVFLGLLISLVLSQVFSYVIVQKRIRERYAEHLRILISLKIKVLKSPENFNEEKIINSVDNIKRELDKIKS